MKLSAFSVAMVSVLLVSASAQAFPFGNSDSKEPTTAAAQDSGKSSAGYQSERFRNMDKNHDGKISEEEFLADQRAEFSRLDQDHDKSISPDELDLPPGLSAEQKNVMRKQMQDREDMMKKRRADMDKRMQEDQKRMKAEQEAQQKASAAAATAAATHPPVKAEEVKKDAVDAKKEETPKPAVTSTATTTAPAFTSESAGKPVTYTSSITAPTFTSGSAGKAVTFTSATAVVPHPVVPAVTPHTATPPAKH